MGQCITFVRFLRLLLSAVCGLLALDAAADPLHFAPLSSETLSALIAPAPTAGSLEEKEELNTLLHLQSVRTPAEVRWAVRADDFEIFTLFGEAELLGVGFTERNAPRLAALLERCTEDQAVVFGLARRFARRRPFAIDARIKPCLPTKNLGLYSYPSSHAFRAYFTAAVLAEIYPNARAQVYDCAQRIAFSRLGAGVHFPSDVEAARRLAGEVAALELANLAFQNELKACRAEAEQARAATR